MNEMEVFKNNELGMQARIITNPDGSISISAEDTAIGFGWIQTQNKNGKSKPCFIPFFPSLIRIKKYHPFSWICAMLLYDS